MLPYPLNRFFSTYRLVKLCIVAGGLLLSLGLPGWAQRQTPLQPASHQPAAQVATLAAATQSAQPEDAQQARVVDERETLSPEASEETSSEGGGLSQLEEQLKRLNMSSGEFDWRVDWWKYLAIAIVFILVLLALMHVGKVLLRLLAFVACMAFSTFFAYYLGPLFAPWLLENVPQLNMPNIPILYWSYAIVFLGAYIVATIILFIIKKPFDITASKKGGK